MCLVCIIVTPVNLAFNPGLDRPKVQNGILEQKEDVLKHSSHDVIPS